MAGCRGRDGTLASRSRGEVGIYRIESPIGAGGIGVVFRANDTRLRRQVAIKSLFDDLADAAARRRFNRDVCRRHRRSTIRTSSLFYDVGEFERRQYLVTEFVDVGALRSWAQQQPRNREDVAQLVTGIADGLPAAHEPGILHRDIKPDNTASDAIFGRSRIAALWTIRRLNYGVRHKISA